MVRVSDLLYGATTQCKSCNMRARNAAKPEEARLALARKASEKAAETASTRRDAYRVKYGDEQVAAVRKSLVSAKQRCTNPSTHQYADYGGRGVRFLFADVASGVRWVLDNIGPRPTAEHTLDRIDNSKGYEPGNLRWATRVEQNRNRRAHKLSANGARIAELMKVRQDLCYETIRSWIKQGRSDEEILNRRKYAATAKATGSGI